MTGDTTNGDGTPWARLTAFEGNVVYAIARLTRADETPYGLAIKGVLEELYGDDINHGRLYPALDNLVDKGLIEKGEVDKRTNEYTLTDEGWDALHSRVERLNGVVDDV